MASSSSSVSSVQAIKPPKHLSEYHELLVADPKTDIEAVYADLYKKAIDSLEKQINNISCKPAIYKVTNSNSESKSVVYLLGTCHAGSKDLKKKFSELVSPYLQLSDQIAVELDIVKFAPKIVTRVLADQSASAGAIYSSKLFANPLFRKLGIAAKFGVDQFIIQNGYDRGINVSSLETVETQVETLQIFSKNKSNHLSDALLCAFALVASYSGDMETIEYVRKISNYQCNDLTQHFIKREENMQKKVEEYLDTDKITLVAVGALHLVSASGLAARLGKDYKVERIQS